MNDRKLVDIGGDAPATDQSELLRVFEKLTDLMLAGEHEQCAELLEQYPHYADELESALPAIEIMHDVKSSGAGDFNYTWDHIEPLVSLKRRLGDFQLIREIGRGGMGIVYEAEQLSLRRKVALKVLPFAGMLDPRQIARFENEARAAATVHHTNIVPIHFVGSDRNVHFYAMQLIDGASLAEVIAAIRQSRDERQEPEKTPLTATRMRSANPASNRRLILHSLFPVPHPTRMASPPSPPSANPVPSATSTASPNSAFKPPTPCITPTKTASCTATSNQPISCSTGRASFG